MDILGEDKAPLVEALSSFVCAYQDEESLDVEHFLKTEAIRKEETGASRTYLMINDEAWENGQIQIDGYFTIALNTLWFNNVDREAVEGKFDYTSRKYCPAFLIGQLARGVTAPKGAGKEYLAIALSYISAASDIVGGRLVYLDCTPSRRKYYEEQGFSFLQNTKKYIQMYKII